MYQAKRAAAVVREWVLEPILKLGTATLVVGAAALAVASVGSLAAAAVIIIYFTFSGELPWWVLLLWPFMFLPLIGLLTVGGKEARAWAWRRQSAREQRLIRERVAHVFAEEKRLRAAGEYAKADRLMADEYGLPPRVPYDP